MAQDGITRKLAAIVSTDVVGYSRLMAADEAGTLGALKAHREELIDPKLAEHGGRIVKLMGDGMLLEFPSVVEAVTACSEIQHLMRERNAPVPEDQRIELRIGINQGEVVTEGDDIYGDGVNIAARLQELAEPGGISVSDRVYGDVRGKIGVALEDLGEQQLKNIPEPVRVYRVLPEGATPAAKRPATKQGLAYWPQIAAGAVVLVILVGGALWWFNQRASETTPEFAERTAIPLPDKPSIAVLPFDNLSDDTSKQYFADGMAEDIITDLSKISGLFVIARNSSFQYKGKAADVKTVAAELGVRYVLEGSVRRVGDKVRINAQLIDATTGGHLWAERYDGAIQDIFALQDKVTTHIVSSLAVKLTADEAARTARRETPSAEAHDAFLKGWAHYIQTTPEDYAKAVPLLEKAIARDPNYGRALATLASLHLSARVKRWNESLGVTPDGALERGLAYLGRALKNPTPLAHQVRSGFLIEYSKYDQAIAEADEAIVLDANDPAGYVAKSRALVLAGRPGEAVDLIKRAMRLDPNFPADDLFLLGMAHFGQADYPNAEAALARARRLSPDHPGVLRYLIATYGQLGRRGDAEPMVAKLRKLAESPAVPWLLGTSVTDRTALRYRKPEDTERLHAGLRRGGLPEFDEEWNFDRANRLGGDEIRQLSFGLTHKGYHPKSKLTFTIVRAADGRFTAEGLWKGTGTSRIVGDRLCIFWHAHKTETCAVVYRNPAGSKANGNEFILIQRSGAYPFAVHK